MRVLVVTLHSGEAEYERSVAAVAAQESVSVEHVVFSGLSNLEAHRRCYQAIEDRHGCFDIAVKVDADMVLRSPGVLRAIGEWFVDQPALDHAQLAIHDFYTDRAIMGLQVFSPSARWGQLAESLFVDASPTVPGRRAVIWRPPLPIADHSPDPSPLQAFRFGVHRAQKAFQRDRRRVKGSQAREQWQTLVRTWEAFHETGEVRRGLAVFGADLVWRGEVDTSDGGYRSEAVDAAFLEAPLTTAALRSALAHRWSRPAVRGLGRITALGPRGTVRSLAAGLRRPRPSSTGEWIK